MATGGRYPEFDTDRIIAPSARRAPGRRASGLGCTLVAFMLIAIGALLVYVLEDGDWLPGIGAILLILAGMTTLVMQIIILVSAFVIAPASREARALSTAALPASVLRLQPPTTLRFTNDRVVVMMARPHDLAELVDAFAERTGAGPTLKGVAPNGWPAASMRVGDRRAVWAVLLFDPIDHGDALVFGGRVHEQPIAATPDDRWFLVAIRIGSQVGTAALGETASAVDGVLDGYRAARGTDCVLPCSAVTATAMIEKARDAQAETEPGESSPG